MKMETSIVAKEDGVIDRIYVKEGEKVSQGDLLVSFVFMLFFSVYAIPGELKSCFLLFIRRHIGEFFFTAA